MKTINIKGKEYVPVVERVKEFHKTYPRGEIKTEIISDAENRVVVKATISMGDIKYDAETKENNFHDVRIFTGHSQAEWGKGLMGAVALEVAETSAVGRALGFAGIGLIDGIASADEMRKVKTPKVGEDDDDLF